MVLDKVVVGLLEPIKAEYEQMNEERQLLIEAVRSHGFEVITRTCMWPRNTYVRDGSKIYTAQEHGLFGDEGYVLLTPDLAIAASTLVCQRGVDAEESQ